MVSNLRRRLSRLRDDMLAYGERRGLALLNRGVRILQGTHPKIAEERLKLAASGLQNTALTVAVGVFVTPHLNAAFVVTPPWLYGTGILVIMLIVASQGLLGYIPKPKDTETRP